METFVPLWNTIMAIGTMIWLVVAVLLIIMLVTGTGKSITNWFGKNALWIAFLIAFACIIGSLTYSEIIGYPACLFCWYQRIVIYPQLVIFGIVLLYKKDTLLALWQGLALSVISIVIGSIHYFIIDLGGKEVGNCVASGVSCTTRYVYEWGFVTIPLMGLVGGLLLFSLAWVGLKYRKSQLSTNTLPIQ